MDYMLIHFIIGLVLGLTLGSYDYLSMKKDHDIPYVFILAVYTLVWPAGLFCTIQTAYLRGNKEC